MWRRDPKAGFVPATSRRGTGPSPPPGGLVTLAVSLAVPSVHLSPSRQHRVRSASGSLHLDRRQLPGSRNHLTARICALLASLFKPKCNVTRVRAGAPVQLGVVMRHSPPSGGTVALHEEGSAVPPGGRRAGMAVVKARRWEIEHCWSLVERTNQLPHYPDYSGPRQRAS